MMLHTLFNFQCPYCLFRLVFPLLGFLFPRAAEFHYIMFAATLSTIFDSLRASNFLELSCHNRLLIGLMGDGLSV